MHSLPDFEIKQPGEISKEFLKRNILTFKSAAAFVANLNYKRNTDKNNLKTVFTDNCGTCGTKHALLKQLADENGFEEIKLVTGIFRMDSRYSRKISRTLEKNSLEFIPEAHNYLKFKNTIFDFTRAGSKAADFENELLEEIEITPVQISHYKVNFHKTFLQKWLNENQEIKFKLDELWKIREECIRDLSSD